MEIAATSMATSSISLHSWCLCDRNHLKNSSFACFKSIGDIHGTNSFSTPKYRLAVSNAVGNEHSQRSSLESLFCYDKAVPEEIIEKPIGLSLSEKDTGGNPRCPHCLTRGAVLCATCSGSGLYIDSILESQGIIVKVRCVGCGGSGNIMCSGCGGRGHLGSDD